MQKKRHHDRRNGYSNKQAKSYHVSGINPVVTLLERDPSKVLNISLSIADKVSVRLQKALKLIEQHDIPIQNINADVFKERFQGVSQGIAAEVLIPKAQSNHDFVQWIEKKLPGNALILILDQIQDPHNLGAILRTADATGVDAVIISDKNTVPLNATVSKVASGAAESVLLFRVTNLNRAIELIKQQGIWLVGTADHAEKTLHGMSFSGSLALVMGSEGVGMRRLTEQACDYLVKLPMAGVVNSLNVSVATGVCLYEINRQRQL